MKAAEAGASGAAAVGPGAEAQGIAPIAENDDQKQKQRVGKEKEEEATAPVPDKVPAVNTTLPLSPLIRFTISTAGPSGWHARVLRREKTGKGRLRTSLCWTESSRQQNERRTRGKLRELASKSLYELLCYSAGAFLKLRFMHA